jgi:hypothetical protein
MKIELKIIPTLIVIIVLVIVLLFAAYVFFPIPDHQLSKENFVKISGRVEFAGMGSSTTKPSTVEVYYPYSNQNRICQGDLLGTSKINWINETEGTYELPIRLPIDMNVIITTNCSGCQHINELIVLNEKEKKVNLKWDSQQCDTETEVPEDLTKLLDNARSRNLRTEELYYENTLTKEQKTEIMASLQESTEFITKAERENSLSYAYAGFGFSIYAYRNSHLFDLNNCVKEIEILIENYNNSCYQIPYEEYRKFQDVKNRCENQTKEYYNLDVFYKDDLEKTKSEAHKLADNLGYTLDAKSACNRPLELIKKSIEFQKPYCDGRNIINYALYFAFLVLGIVIGASICRWIGEE